MEPTNEVVLTDKQVVLDTIAKGVLAVVASTFLRIGIEKAYDSVMTSRRQPQNAA